MTTDPSAEKILDAAAEALILVDPADPASIDQLDASLVAVRRLFDPTLPEDHPALAALRAVERLEAGDESALAEIEAGFSACRELASRPATTPQAAPKSSERRARQQTAPASAMPLAGDEELIRDFVVRATEHLDDADERLLALEADPRDAEAVDAVFRAFHTIKGMAGFLALDDISEHSHSSENLLAASRKTGEAVPEPAIVELFSAVDRMRDLVAVASGVASGAPTAAPGASRDDASVAPAVAAPADAAAAEPASGLGATAQGSVRAGTVRIEEARLDALLDTIGELVISESMVSASARHGEAAAVLESQVERLDKITRELQQMATSLRMVPLRATFRRMARVVRDVATKAGKHVDFVIVGDDTELDKIVVDRISDPLVHALRNAVDHGIESPAERVAAGKPERGRVELRAFHAGGAIHIEVSDDGRGLDAERITQCARERGLLGGDDVPDERALQDLVFAPGLSTAQAVTDVSGRGVGMDVVKRTVDELRGRLELRSTPGAGTTLGIRLPMTLAIIDGMMLRVGSERYVLPILSIERSVRPSRDEIATVAGRGEMLVSGEGLVPVLRLHEMFNTPGAQTDVTEAVVVIIDDNGVRAGLLACELLGQQQTVIKPLGDGLPDQPGITGGAIMSDGRVGLILDAAGLVRAANSSGGE